MKNKKFNAYLEQPYLGIAHRGLHNEEYTENGLKAFKHAMDYNLAFELDIHLTKDGELVVCHDSELARTTGKKGIIEELTLKEIKENYTLLDGGEIPTFQEVLDLNQEKEVIVVELKVYQNNWYRLAKAAKKILRQIVDTKKIVLISFDPRALFFAGHRFQRQLLICKGEAWTWRFRHLFDSVDIDRLLVKEKKVQKYRKHGNIVNVWTITNEEELKEVSPYADMITFQDFSLNSVIEDRKEYLKNRK